MRRALAAGAVAGVAAAAGLIELHAEARYVFDRLVDQGLPLVILSALCGLALLVLLLRGSTGRKRPNGGRLRPTGRGFLRPLAAGAVVERDLGLGGGAVSLFAAASLRIDQAAAPDPTLSVVFIVFAAAAVLVLPSLGLLYTLSQRDLLEAEH